MSAIDSVSVVRLARAAAQVEPRPTIADFGLEAEQSVLGALFIDRTAIERVDGRLRVEHFASADHRAIYQAILDEREESNIIDAVSVGARLARNGGNDLTAYLAALAANTPSARNVERYAELVREHAQRREIAALGARLAEAATSSADLAELRREAARLAEMGTDRDAWPAPLDLAALAEREPQRPQHVIADWLPAGEVTLFAGHGGAGKSIVALHLAACVALGRPWCGLDTERRRVVYLSAEDRADVLHWRLARICAYLGVGMGELVGWLRVIDASAIECELMIDPGRGEEPIYTRYYDALARLMREAQVLILDGASDLYGASEIVRRYVRRYIRALRRLAPAEGAVLLLAHLDKAAARDGSTTDRYSGSTAWHNSVRSRWALGAEPDGDALVLTLAKANHARAGAEIRLRWDDTAHLYVADRVPTEGGMVGAIRERQEREGILTAMRACAEAGIVVPAATQGPRTAYHVLRAQPAFPDALRADTAAVRRRFWALIEELRAFGAIEERVIRAQHRHAVATLVLAAGAS